MITCSLRSCPASLACLTLTLALGCVHTRSVEGLPTQAFSDTVELGCSPEAPHADFLEVAVFVSGPCQAAFDLASDLANNDAP